jgi:hypothetical protein
LLCSKEAGLSDDRLMQILQSLVILLFVSVGALALGRAPQPWVKWTRLGAIVMFTAAMLYALILTLRWALGEGSD